MSVEELALNLTKLGLEKMVEHAQKQLSKLDELASLLGPRGVEIRAQGWDHWAGKMDKAEAALRLRKAAGGS